MGSKNRPKIQGFESDPYDDFDGKLDDDPGGFSDTSKESLSTDWGDPASSDVGFSARRQIERQNDLKELYAQFDDGDEIDFGNEW